MSKKPDVYEYIFKKYPRVFAGGNTIELYNAGWADIINDLCFVINEELESMPEELAVGIYATQIKTKFGGLRAYFNHMTPFMDGAILLAENISRRTCEVCGLPGKSITIGGWMDTLCPICIEIKAKSINI